MTTNKNDVLSLRVYASKANIENIKGFIELLKRDSGDKINFWDSDMETEESALRGLIHKYCSPITGKPTITKRGEQ